MAKFSGYHGLIAGLLVSTALAYPGVAAAEGSSAYTPSPVDSPVVIQETKFGETLTPQPKDSKFGQTLTPEAADPKAEEKPPVAHYVGTGALENKTLIEEIHPEVEVPSRATINGSLGVAGRVYFEDAPFAGQNVNHLDGYGFVTLNGEYKLTDNDRLKMALYGRMAPFNSHSLFDAREAYYIHSASTWDILLGYDTVAWGVTESRHLVDVINQRDIGGNLNDDYDRLGQPMANLNIVSPTLGTLSLYTLFGFRERDFPERGDRLRAAYIVDEGDAQFGGGDIDQVVNFAGRYKNSVGMMGGSLDFAVSYFHGLSRDPRLALVFPGKIVPVYDLMDQVGLEGLYAYKDLQLKFEGLSRWQNGEQYFASVSGLEYTLHDIFNGAADLGLMGEYMYDGRSSDPRKQPSTPFDNDVFAGVRLTFNDAATTRIKAGVVVDVHDQSTYGSLEFQRRLRDDLLLSVDARTFDGISPKNYFGFLDTESFVEMAIQKFF